MTERRSRRAARLAASSLIALLAGAAAAAPAAPAAPAADPVASIAPSLIGELREAGLIGVAEPVRAFTWSTVMTRPLRAPRRHRETFAGTPPGDPAGLSPMVREELAEDGSTKRIVRGVSVRGLIFVKPRDTALDVRVRDLHMPLTRGERFRIEYDDGDGQLVEDCRVGGEVAASTLHSAIPGSATRIDCTGAGRYKRIGVNVSATVMYLHEPGVFVGVEQAIDSPLGRLRSGVRIVSFSMDSH
ncbi:MAG: hypothetical protein M9885_07550 [Burkholderiaceae bacterium]|nr:hypothetical protein [Burkholderiaceae bacterium]